MNIAVIGGGAIGSLVAAYLHKSGEDVVLVGREEHVKVVNKKGLSIINSSGNENIKVRAVTRLEEEYSLVIFATKTQDLEKAYDENNEFLESCLVLTTQNGVQADNILSSHFEPDQMFSSIVMFGATYMKPGEITFNFPGDWILGRSFKKLDAKTHELKEILRAAFPVVISEDIIGMKWLKLFVNFNNCLPAVIGKSMQETFSDMDLCRLSVRLLKEGVDIVQQAKIELVSLPDFSTEKILGLVNMPEDQAASIINQTLPGLSKEPLYGSILQSIMRKKISEIDFINGEVVHMATQISQQAPLNDRIVGMVHQVENNGKYFKIEEIKQAFAL